jgi:hypothetical protein
MSGTRERKPKWTQPQFSPQRLAAFLLAGFVKGVIGLGLPTVSIGLLGLLVSPAQAAAILVVPSLITNVWQAVLAADLSRCYTACGRCSAASASALSLARCCCHMTIRKERRFGSG